MPCSCHTAAAISQWPSARPQCDGGGFDKLVARNQPVQSVTAVPVIMMAPSCPWSPSDRIRLGCVYACVMLRMGCSLMNCRRLIASSTVWRVDAAGPAEPKKQAGPWAPDIADPTAGGVPAAACAALAAAATGLHSSRQASWCHALTRRRSSRQQSLQRAAPRGSKTASLLRRRAVLYSSHRSVLRQGDQGRLLLRWLRWSGPACASAAAAAADAAAAAIKGVGSTGKPLATLCWSIASVLPTAVVPLGPVQRNS